MTLDDMRPLPVLPVYLEGSKVIERRCRMLAGEKGRRKKMAVACLMRKHVSFEQAARESLRSNYWG